MPQQPFNDLLTVPESAAFLRLKTPTIRAWVLGRKIPFVRVGRRVLVRRRDLEQLIESSTVPAQKAA